MLRLLVLYTALALGANGVMAADLSALKTGEMKKLVVYDDPLPVPELPFTDPDGAELRLQDYAGKVILVNMWATWCAPCREEMPELDALQAEMGGDAFEVLTIATGRNPPRKVDSFFEEAGVTHLPKFRDENQKLARAMGILGLPVTVLIDQNGQEVARLIGGADWASDDAKAVIKALIN
ncbi:thioredoxin [Thioclava sp. SK-1]|uniref:TlpA family protein disulfide reductase n=1 Tax=Thioclava sp. SK-1 TaxID=1889770 RepID=UPI0008243CC5|nr:TlpA disulfide reductase family protein [Thioclava sp. SK-1]OCX61037.1 thioredoxin [Thioclava sp. SK-1]